MLFLLFGSSGAGKTTALRALRDRVAGLAVHDFDEVGVPPGADLSWRHRTNEAWVRRGLDYQREGVDLLLAGQTPLGEVLAAPSATALEAVSACLLDCDDETRLSRLEDRGPDWLARVGGDMQPHLGWATWLRGHAADPAHRPEVIRRPDPASDMRWARWSTWRAGDPRWRVPTIDTSRSGVEQVAARLADWIEGERALLRAGSHPLAPLREA